MYDEKPIASNSHFINSKSSCRKNIQFVKNNKLSSALKPSLPNLQDGCVGSKRCSILSNFKFINMEKISKIKNHQDCNYVPQECSQCSRNGFPKIYQVRSKRFSKKILNGFSPSAKVRHYHLFERAI